jgi:hypothetical protein
MPPVIPVTPVLRFHRHTDARYRWTVRRLTPRAAAISGSVSPRFRRSSARSGFAFVVPGFRIERTISGGLEGNRPGAWGTVRYSADRSPASIRCSMARRLFRQSFASRT